MNNDHLRFSPTFHSLVDTMRRLGGSVYRPIQNVEAMVEASLRFYPRFQQLRSILPRDTEATMETILNELLFATIDLNTDSTESFLLAVYAELLELEERDRIYEVVREQLAQDLAMEAAANSRFEFVPLPCPICGSTQLVNEPCQCIIALETEDGDDWQGFARTSDRSRAKKQRSAIQRERFED